MEEKNKIEKSEKNKEVSPKPYSLLMNHVPEDKREHKNKFWTKDRLFVLGFVLLIIIVNLVNVFPLFKAGYPQIDSALMKSVAQLNLLDHNLLGTWNHLWYLGSPWYLFNNPTLYPAAYIKFFLGFLDIGMVIKMLMGLIYLAIPVGLYFFVRYISKKEFTAILAALIFSAPPFLLIWVPEVKNVFSQLGFIPWSIYKINSAGYEFNHLFGLAFVPFALILFLKTLRKYNFKNLVVAAVIFSIAGFASSLALYSLIFLSIFLIFSEIILGNPGQKIKRAFMVYLVSLGFLANWFNLPFLRNNYLYSNSGAVLKDLASLIPLGFVFLPILATVLFLIFDRKPKLQILFISLIWVIFFAAIVSFWSFGNKFISPSAERFMIELWMGLSILAAYLLSQLIVGLKQYVLAKLNQERANIAIIGLIIVFICLAIGFTTWHFKASNQSLEPISKNELQKSDEYKVADWLNQNVSDTERVYVTGNLSHLLNSFFLVPQVRGSSDVGSINNLWKRGAEEIEMGTEISKTESYLRIFGAKYVVVKKPGQNETDRTNWDFQYPEKFTNSKILVLENKIGPYEIYKVELNSYSFAQKVDLLAYSDLQKVNYEDNLEGLANILDKKGNEADFEWDAVNKIQVNAPLEENQAIVLRENFYNIWKGNPGNNVTVDKDSLGFIYLKPKTSGQIKIQLSAGRDTSQYIGFLLTILTVILIILFRTKKIKKYVENYQTLPSPKGLVIEAPKKETFVDMMTDHEEELARLGEKAKEHYQKEAEFDWLEKTDNFASLSGYFHRNREEISKKLIKKFGFGDKYLDVGCGTGFLLRYLPKGSIGLDINPQNIAQAKKNVPDAALVVADIENIPFPSDMFTTVICTEVLDRLPHPQKAIKEIFRILKPGGVLIGTVPRENPLWRLRFLSSAYSPEPYRFEFSREEVEKLLAPFEKVLIAPTLSYMTWAIVMKKKEGIF